MTGNPFSQLAASGRRRRRTEGDDETPRVQLGREGLGAGRGEEAESFIAIPSGGGATRQLKCLLSVPFKSEQ